MYTTCKILNNGHTIREYPGTDINNLCVFQVLVAEIEQKQSRIDECQKYSEQYSSAIKVILLNLLSIFIHYFNLLYLISP